jgi:hypothetical protein
MINDLDARDPAIGEKVALNQVPKVIIAESGVTTGFNITECNITVIPSSNARHRNTQPIDMEMTITEPYSMNLPDRLFDTAKQLGIPNWRLAQHFLEIEFRMINEDGTMANVATGKTN